MLKDFLNNFKLYTDPLQVVNPTTSDTGTNSEKENASIKRDKLPQGTSGENTIALVPPAMVYGGPVHPSHIIDLVPPPKLLKNDFAKWVFRIMSWLTLATATLISHQYNNIQSS